MRNSKFWMVWCPQGYPPKREHKDEGAANREAERLAAENPGKRFYVLEAMRYREVNNMDRVELVHDLPF